MSEQEFADFEVNLNLEETPAWDGELAPLPDPGEYTLLIVDVKNKPGQKAPMIAVTFEIQDEGAWKDAKVYNNYSLSNAALGRIKQLGVAVGASLDKIVASEYMGATILATVYHSEGKADVDANGNPREARMFANVKNERAVPVTPAPAAKAPPVQKTAPAATPAAKPANNAARRA